MSRDADDEDHSRFIRLEGLTNDAGDEAVLSLAAFQMHTFGIMNSIKDGHPGFVSDDYLNAITAETTVTAAELCAAGLWERGEGGYRVLDHDTLAMALDADRRISMKVSTCLANGGHYDDPQRPGWCDVCGHRLG